MTHHDTDQGDRNDDVAVLDVLRGVMDEAVGDTTRPAPRWDELERRLREVRRRRRLGDAGRTVAIAGVVSAAVLGATVVVPGLDTSPRPAVTSPSSTRGSLGGDAAWLAGLREHLAALPEGAPVRDQKVLFAGDVGPYRLALVDAPWRPLSAAASAAATTPAASFPAPVVPERAAVWFLGAAGAPPERMQPSRSGNGACLDPADRCANPLSTGNPADAISLVLDSRSFDADAVPGVRRGNRAVVVVVPLRPMTVTLTGPPQYAGDGSVDHPRAAPLPESYGVRQAVITTGGRHRLVVGDRGPEEVWPDLFSAPDFPTDGVTPTLHGAVTPPPHEVQGALAALQYASGLPVSGSPRRLLWAGTIGDVRSGVLAFTTAGGVHVVGVFRQRGAPDVMGTWLTAAAVLPAGPLEDVAVAWHNPLPQRSGDAGDPRPSGQIAVLGPSGATSAAFLDAEDRPLAEADLTDGFGMAAAPGARSVQFSDATGRVVTTAPVRPLLGLDDALDR